jgi:hypothetical protein
VRTQLKTRTGLVVAGLLALTGLLCSAPVAAADGTWQSTRWTASASSRWGDSASSRWGDSAPSRWGDSASSRSDDSTQPSVAAPAPPVAGCPSSPSSQVFAPFGDQAYYTQVPGATIGGEMEGWNLDLATTVDGGDGFGLGDSDANQSLWIDAGGLAESGTFCLSNQYPTWRFAAKSDTPDEAGGLDVWVVWTDASGDSGETQATTLAPSDYAGWSLTPSLDLGTTLSDGATVTARLVFENGADAGWSIDDIYLDPYSRGS